jgi:hypothetical protein
MVEAFVLESIHNSGGEHKRAELGDWVELSIHLQIYNSLERTSFVTHAARGTELTEFTRAALPAWLAARAADVYNRRPEGSGALRAVAPEDVSPYSIILRRDHTYLAPGFRFLKDTELVAELHLLPAEVAALEPLALSPAEASELVEPLAEAAPAKKRSG